MARPDREKCRLCAKLSAREAQQRHGATGDGCWDAEHCHNRRSYYRHRGMRNHLRKERRQAGQAPAAASDPTQAPTRPAAPAVITIELPAPAVPAAVVHWYRETKDAPLHALGAQLWMGNDRVAQITPVHCLGLTESQVRALLLQILSVFSQQAGVKLERFRSAVELHPHNCPIRPCPLHPEEMQ